MTSETGSGGAPSILFVDDEQAILDGLRNVLRPDRKRWNQRFALGGERALESMAEAPADVVVTDMRMPGMDGLTLLRRVQASWPDAARVVLSGYADLAAVASASSVAHQYLLKPCDADVLRRVLERAFDLLDLFRDPQLRRVAGSLGALPSLPRLYDALTRALADPDVDVKRLAAIIREDVGMSSRALQFVNSAYYGLTKRVSSIETALVYIGLNTLRHLALTLQVFKSFSSAVPPSAVEAFEGHAILTARLARRLAPDEVLGEAAFAAGLLHDAGRLVLMERCPVPYAEAVALARGGMTLHDAERQVFGATHAEVGAYLLGLWGIPHGIVEAVAFHHDEARMSRGLPDTVLAVGAASLLSHGGGEEGLGPEEAALLARLAGSHLPEWRALAEEVRAGTDHDEGTP
jgi:HD-like signal output (HDOD) protein/ActR/RegA family two-component response regulator